MASPGPSFGPGGSGRLRWLRMSTTVELSLLGLLAAAAGSFAFVDGDMAFTVIFMVMSGFALGHVFRGE